MSSNATSDRSSENRGGEEVTSKVERHEVFEATGAGSARVTTSSGDVTIGASESNVIEVTLSVKDPSYQRMLDEAIIEYDARKNALVVRTRTHENFNADAGLPGRDPPQLRGSSSDPTPTSTSRFPKDRRSR